MPLVRFDSEKENQMRERSSRPVCLSIRKLVPFIHAMLITIQTQQFNGQHPQLPIAQMQDLLVEEIGLSRLVPAVVHPPQPPVPPAALWLPRFAYVLVGVVADNISRTPKQLQVQ